MVKLYEIKHVDDGKDDLTVRITNGWLALASVSTVLLWGVAYPMSVGQIAGFGTVTALLTATCIASCVQMMVTLEPDIVIKFNNGLRHLRFAQEFVVKLLSLMV